jgi:ATP synthase protein I
MSDGPKHDRRTAPRPLEEQVGEKEIRKVRARRAGDRSIWFGLGMFGVVGWSVAIPTVLGLALGIWIDSNYASRYSWTLMGLLIGLLVGCINAWYWVTSEGRLDEDLEGDEEQESS